MGECWTTGPQQQSLILRILIHYESRKYDLLQTQQNFPQLLTIADSGNNNLTKHKYLEGTLSDISIQNSNCCFSTEVYNLFKYLPILLLIRPTVLTVSFLFFGVNLKTSQRVTDCTCNNHNTISLGSISIFCLASWCCSIQCSQVSWTVSDNSLTASHMTLSDTMKYSYQEEKQNTFPALFLHVLQPKDFSAFNNNDPPSSYDMHSTALAKVFMMMGSTGCPWPASCRVVVSPNNFVALGNALSQGCSVASFRLQNCCLYCSCKCFSTSVSHESIIII